MPWMSNSAITIFHRPADSSREKRNDSEITLDSQWCGKLRNW